jgi:hypothetical protein
MQGTTRMLTRFERILTFLLTVFPAPGIAKIIKTEEVSEHGKQALD